MRTSVLATAGPHCPHHGPWTLALNISHGKAVAPTHQNNNFWDDLIVEYFSKHRRNEEEKSELCRVQIQKCFHFDWHAAAQRGSSRIPSSPLRASGASPASPCHRTILDPQHQEPISLSRGAAMFIDFPQRLFNRYGWKIPLILGNNRTFTFYLLDKNRTKMTVFINFENITTLSLFLIFPIKLRVFTVFKQQRL